MLSDDVKTLTLQVRDKILSEYEELFLDIDNVKRLDEQKEIIRKELRSLIGKEDQELEEQVIAELIGLRQIEPLLKDPMLNEIMINGREVWIDRNGELIKTDIVFEDIKEVESLLQRIMQLSHRKIDWSNPIVDAKLPDGSRVNAVIEPSAEFPVITIRRFVEHFFTLEELVEQGYISEDMAKFFELVVKGRLNILLCGAASSSKTTFLRTLGNLVPENERLIVIEDTREAKIKHPHCISLEASDKASVYDLMVCALRMRPDRIILGECRGIETFQLLQAMGTGHNGSITTVHANSAKKDAFERLIRAMIRSGLTERELLAQLSSTIDITVFMRKFQNGKRRIINVCEVINNNGVPYYNEIYTYDYNSNRHICINPISKSLAERLKNNLEVNTLPPIDAFREVFSERMVGVC